MKQEEKKNTAQKEKIKDNIFLKKALESFNLERVPNEQIICKAL